MEKNLKATGYEYMRMRSRQESAEAELYEQKGENAALRRLLEERKRSVEELTEQLRETKVLLEEQKYNVQELTDEVSNRNSRELEADICFMAGDHEENRIVEEKLRQMGKQLQLRVNKLIKLEKEVSDRCKAEKKRKDRKLKHKSKTKLQVLRAFQWEKNTANPVLLRAVITSISGMNCLILRRRVTNVVRNNACWLP
jgi:hypothetical protein